MIVDVAAAAAEGAQAVAEAGIRAVRPLLAADAAAIVRWQDGRPVVLAADGDLDGLLGGRQPEGAGWADGRPVAAVSVDPRTDVVVSRSAPIAFAETDLEALRALGELINWAGGGRQPDALLRGSAARVVASLEPDEVLVSVTDAVARLLRAEIAGVLLRDAAGGCRRRRRPGLGPGRAARRVMAAGGWGPRGRVTFGHLALALPAAPTAGDRLAAEHAAVVSALLLAREEAAVAAARRLQSEFVWDMLDGRLPDAVEASVRARHLGTGFALPARAVAIMVSGLAYGATAGGWNPEHLERARSACARAIGQCLTTAGVSGAVLARRANLFAAVVPGDAGLDIATARRLAGALAAIPWQDGTSATVGVGGPVDAVSGFPAGWREAQLARSAVGASGEPAVFEDLGVLQFLLAPTSGDDLDGFARRQLGPVLDYDARRDTELTRTLDVYLRAGCSTRRTAELMCIHHRTVPTGWRGSASSRPVPRRPGGPVPGAARLQDPRAGPAERRHPAVAGPASGGVRRCAPP